MKAGTNLGILALATSLAISAGDASAALATYEYSSNAVNYCQAFTPGPANTIRNRVVGAENVGTVPMNVACNFGSMTNGAAGQTPPTSIYVYFSNNTAAEITISCTLLTGYVGSSSSYMVGKSVVVPAKTYADYSLDWSAADNPDQPATDLGDYLVGINCILPPGAVINDTYIQQTMDNGVGN